MRRVGISSSSPDRASPSRAAPARVAHERRGDRAVLEANAVKLRVEVHLAARLLDLTAQGAHHLDQQVGSDMGLRLPEDLLGRAGIDEPAQHVGQKRAFHVGGELAVRERAGASLSELDVRTRIQRPAGVERRHGRLALVDVAAALQHQRTQPRARQAQRREQARGTRSHDDGTRLRIACRLRDRGDLERGVRLVLLDVLQTEEIRLLPRVFERHAQRRDEMHVARGLLARVDAALEQPHLGDLARIHAQSARGGALHQVEPPGKAGIERQPHIRNLKHGIPPFPQHQPIRCLSFAIISHLRSSA